MASNPSLTRGHSQNVNLVTWVDTRIRKKNCRVWLVFQDYTRIKKVKLNALNVFLDNTKRTSNKQIVQPVQMDNTPTTVMEVLRAKRALPANRETRVVVVRLVPKVHFAPQPTVSQTQHHRVRTAQLVPSRTKLQNQIASNVVLAGLQTKRVNHTATTVPQGCIKTK